jgi:hypothetical protein
MHISILTRYERGGRMFKNWLKRITTTAHSLNKQNKQQNICVENEKKRL